MIFNIQENDENKIINFLSSCNDKASKVVIIERNSCEKEKYNGHWCFSDGFMSGISFL